jgi:hypothetical protein
MGYKWERTMHYEFNWLGIHEVYGICYFIKYLYIKVGLEIDILRVQFIQQQ